MLIVLEMECKDEEDAARKLWQVKDAMLKKGYPGYYDPGCFTVSIKDVPCTSNSTT